MGDRKQVPRITTVGSTDDWERTKQALVNSYFPGLSSEIVITAPQGEALTSALMDNSRTPSSTDSGSSSPLPELFVECVAKRPDYDEPEDFYRELAIICREYCKEFGIGSQRAQVAADQNITRVETGDRKSVDEEMGNDDNLEEDEADDDDDEDSTQQPDGRESSTRGSQRFQVAADQDFTGVETDESVDEEMGNDDNLEEDETDDDDEDSTQQPDERESSTRGLSPILEVTEPQVEALTTTLIDESGTSSSTDFGSSSPLPELEWESSTQGLSSEIEVTAPQGEGLTSTLMDKRGTSSSTDSRSFSPLPELIVECVPKRPDDDEPEEFYRELAIRCREYYKQFGIASQRGQVAADQDITGVETGDRKSVDEKIENGNKNLGEGSDNSDEVNPSSREKSFSFKAKRAKSSGALSSKRRKTNEKDGYHSSLEAVRCNAEATSAHSSRISLDENMLSPPTFTSDFNTSPLAFEAISDRNDIMTNSAEVREIEEPRSSDYNVRLRSSTPRRRDRLETFDSRNNTQSEHVFVSRGVQTSPRNMGTRSSSEEGVSWDEIRNDLFVGSPLVYSLEAVRCNSESTSAHSLRISLDENTPYFNTSPLAFEGISNRNDIMTNSAEVREMEEPRSGDFNVSLRLSTPKRSNRLETFDSRNNTQSEHISVSNGVQTSPRDMGTSSSSEEGVSWDEIRNDLFVGSPLVYSLEAVRCNSESTSAHSLRISLDENTPYFNTSPLAFEGISNRNDIMTNSAEVREMEEPRSGDFNVSLRLSTPKRSNRLETFDSRNNTQSEHISVSNGVQTSPRDMGTSSSSEEGVSWDEIRNDLFVGSPLVYSLDSPETP